MVLCAAALVGCRPDPDDRPPIAADQASLPLADTAEAREVLVAYWNALSAGEHARAAALFGGDWREVAAHWVEPATLDTLSDAGFLASICGRQVVCALRVERVEAAETLSPGHVRLVARMVDRDGTPFTRGPCCGEEGEPQALFPFELRRGPGGFRVLDLPLYVP